MIEWLWMGFGLMIRFTGFFDIARDYTLQFTITHTHTRTERDRHTHNSVHSHVCTSCCSVVASNPDVPLLLGSRTVPGFCYQILTATPHNDWTSAVLWLTNWSTPSLTTQLNSTDSQVRVTLRLTVSQSVSLWSDISSCLTATVLSIWGALSNETTNLSFIKAIYCSCKSVVSMYNIFTFYMLLKVCIYNIYI
jgi:hypothetical protein